MSRGGAAPENKVVIDREKFPPWSQWHLRPEILTSEQALEAARALARAERDKSTNCSSRPPGAGNHPFLSAAPGSIMK